MEIFLNDRVDIKPMHIINARPVPLHYHDKADSHVRKLVNESIITKVDIPTIWCSPAFFVKKPGGGLWLVTDYTGLNKCVHHAAHPFPTTQDIVAGLDPLATVYAKVDALSSYFQVPLSKEASYLMTFLLPSGMYQYLRAPMGLASSSDEFCHRSDAIFSGIPGIRKLVNDILVEGRDLEDLEIKLHKVFWCCSMHGFVLSDKKFEVGA